MCSLTFAFCCCNFDFKVIYITKLFKKNISISMLLKKAFCLNSFFEIPSVACMLVQMWPCSIKRCRSPGSRQNQVERR